MLPRASMVGANPNGSAATLSLASLNPCQVSAAACGAGVDAAIRATRAVRDQRPGDGDILGSFGSSCAWYAQASSRAGADSSGAERRARPADRSYADRRLAAIWT